jgi:hypothetical protein
VNVPEILNRFEELDFDVSLYTGQIASAHNLANHVPPGIRDDEGQSSRQ